MKKTIVLLPGDGIGPEVTRAAATILRESAHEFNHQFEFQELPIGGAAIDSTGKPLPNETLDACRKADAVFLGAVGGPKWDSLHFGERGNITEKGVERAWDTESYTTPEIERIAAFAYTRAESRSRRLCSVDKANVLSSSQLWRRTVTAMSAVYPSVKLEHMYVDNAAMQLTLRPSQFDVLLSSNMFGDILSDAAAALAGSIGLIPSASFGSYAPLFEPIHGSAPSLAGTDSANPIGSILSATLMLREAFGLALEADWAEQSLQRVLASGFRTPDITEPGARAVGGSVFTEILREEMQRTFEHAERYGWGV